jgi:HTH-type transcriptional regulator, competence development regulator
MGQPTKRPGDGIGLGEYLAAVRGDRMMSLRHVEEATNREVSNAYLSQLENGKVKRPSPNILHSLAELYGVPYTTLMEKAGYLKPQGSDSLLENQASGASFSGLGITPEEETELLRFLRFMRSDASKRRSRARSQ